jgi:5-methyltetrahydrofolate corrinoid/iron sulfur protein methyltransferase
MHGYENRGKTGDGGPACRSCGRSRGPLDDLYIDPLVHSIATDTESGLNTMNAIRQIMERFPGVHTTCGLSNISYGLPNRKLVNRTFLVGAIGCGLDSVIIDPTDKWLYGALKAGLMIAGKDASTWAISRRIGKA